MLGELLLWLRPAGWEELGEPPRGRVRALSLFAICAQVLFIAGWIIAGALEHGYSPVRMYVSELGRRGAAHPWIFDVSILVWGAGFVALGLALAVVLRTRPWALVAPGLFVLAGICAMLDAPFRLDCASTISHLCKAREIAGRLSWREYGHIWASFGIEAALLLTPFALARALWPGRLARLVLFGALAVALLLAVLMLLGGWVGAHNSHGGHGGLWQRAWMGVVHVWVLLCASALILQASHGWPGHERHAHSRERSQTLTGEI
ncbi:MAG TPA: DUF998 domain-containing protein [Solirubrobacteraceae bacterium]